MCVSCVRNRKKVIASGKATLVAKSYWNPAAKTATTQALQECDASKQKEIADSLQMRQELEEVRAVHPELVAIKILDVAIGARLVAWHAISRRARELRLPPDWRAVGFHATSKVGKCVRACGVCGTAMIRRQRDWMKMVGTCCLAK